MTDSGKKMGGIRIIAAKDLTEQNIAQFLPRGQENLDTIKPTVSTIIQNVQTQGDVALIEYTQKFDKVDLTALGIEVSELEFEEAKKQMTPELRNALDQAKKNIETFHSAQIHPDWSIETQTGVNTGQIFRPLERVGLYIPGGLAVYPSTVLMTAIPAKVAGVKDIILCSPPQKDGKVASAILYAARLCGVSKVYRCGGAQAIAAMAYGTNTIRPVQKIVGPGNKWVAAAKQIISTKCAIDNPAGPSEVLVAVDCTTNAEYAAWDLFAQIEHGPENVAVLLSQDSTKTREIIENLEKIVSTNPRREIVEKNLRAYSLIIELTEPEIIELEMIRIINLIAPEHLHLESQSAKKMIPKINNSGAIFIGPYSPVPLGDYCAGTNHVLPTAGYARMYSGLSSYDFGKFIDVLECSPQGIVKLEKILTPIAEFEGLKGHRDAVQSRVRQINANPSIFSSQNPFAKIENVENALLTVRRKCFDNLQAYTPGEQPQDPVDWIKLNTNENPNEPIPAVIEALKKAITQRMRMYPDPLAKKLREIITKTYLARFKTYSNPENLVVANGSDEILDILFKSFIDPGDKVIFFKPSYGMYSVLTESYGGKSIELLLNQDFTIPDIAFQQTGKLMIICSPNNPNGNNTPNAVIEQLCRSFPGIIFVDEAYSDFADSTALEILPRCSNLVIGRTFSKSFSLASARLGFAVAHQKIIELFNTIRLPYNVSYLSQTAGIASMENWETINTQIQALKKERDRVISNLLKKGFNILPTQSNFYLIQFKTKIQASTVYRSLKERKILVRYWSKPGLDCYLRVTVGKPIDNDRFVEILTEITNSFK